MRDCFFEPKSGMSGTIINRFLPSALLFQDELNVMASNINFHPGKYRHPTQVFVS